MELRMGPCSPIAPDCAQTVLIKIRNGAESRELREPGVGRAGTTARGRGDPPQPG